MAATVAGMVWVDGLSAQQRDNLRARLTVRPRKTTDIAGAKTPDPILLYRERGDQFGLPRGYWQRHNTGLHLERVAVSYGQPMQPLRSTWTAEGPYAEQAEIVPALHQHLTARSWGGGLLEAAPGTGKTNIAIEVARRIGRSTLVLVQKEFLLKQWRRRIERQLPGARIGIIQQDVCEWQDVDFCIAIMQSLVRDDGAGSKYDPGIYQGFGIVIPDEAHHVPAATFAQILPRFEAAYYLGLSATFRRKDGTEDVFYYQIGPVIYSAKMKAMQPKLRVLSSAARVHDIKRGSYEVPVEKLNSAQVTTQLAKNPLRQRLIVDQVLRAVRGGRKVLVVSERLDHLRAMRLAVTEALAGETVTQGVYTSQWFVNARGNKMRDVKQEELDVSETAQVVWATRQLCDEAMDVPPIDVLILAVPIADAEQIVGRACRWCFPQAEKCQRLCAWRSGACQGKPDPVIIDVRDPLVPKVAGKWRKRRRLYEEMGIKVEFDSGLNKVTK